MSYLKPPPRLPAVPHHWPESSGGDRGIGYPPGPAPSRPSSGEKSEGVENLAIPMQLPRGLGGEAAGGGGRGAGAGPEGGVGEKQQREGSLRGLAEGLRGPRDLLVRDPGNIDELLSMFFQQVGPHSGLGG